MNPEPFTMKELVWMSEAKRKDDWEHTSSLMALTANIFSDTKHAICANELVNWNNLAETKGHFSHKTGNVTVDTWTVRRVGGADASLKFWNNSYNTVLEIP